MVNDFAENFINLEDEIRNGCLSKIESSGDCTYVLWIYEARES